MDTLFNTHFDSTPSSHDLPGVKLKASTYGKNSSTNETDGSKIRSRSCGKTCTFLKQRWDMGTKGYNVCINVFNTTCPCLEDNKDL